MMNAAISTGKIVLYFLLMGLLAVGMIEVVLPAMTAQVSMVGSLPRIVTLGIVNFVAMTLPALLLIAIFDGKSPAAMGFARENALGDFLAGGFVGGFILAAAVAAAVLAGWATFNPDVSTFSMNALVAGTFGMTLAATGEEAMMRGFVLQELMSKFSTATSVVVSSLLFTALHAAALVKSDVAFIAALNIFLAGALFAVAYLATRSLWLPIGIHAGWNIAQGPLMGFNVSGNDLGAAWKPVTMTGPEMMTGGEFGLEGSLLGLIGPTLGILMMLAARKRA